MAEWNENITEETVSYLIDVFNEMCHGEGGDSYLVIDGRTYKTDWGYGVDGIACFIDIISRRNGFGAFDCSRIDYEESEQ
jgi:hypothetical protein